MKLKLFLPALLVLALTTGCTNIKQPEFRRLEKFRVKSIGLTQGTIGLSVTFYNPNNFGVTVKETAGDLYLNSVHLGRFTQDSAISVDKNAEFSIPISCGIPLDQLLQLRGSNFSDKQVLITADGNTKVGKLGVYITKPFHYEGNYSLNQLK